MSDTSEPHGRTLLLMKEHGEDDDVFLHVTQGRTAFISRALLLRMQPSVELPRDGTPDQGPYSRLGTVFSGCVSCISADSCCFSYNPLVVVNEVGGLGKDIFRTRRFECNKV